MKNGLRVQPQLQQLHSGMLHTPKQSTENPKSNFLSTTPTILPKSTSTVEEAFVIFLSHRNDTLPDKKLPCILNPFKEFKLPSSIGTDPVNLFKDKSIKNNRDESLLSSEGILFVKLFDSRNNISKLCN